MITRSLDEMDKFLSKGLKRKKKTYVSLYK